MAKIYLMNNLMQNRIQPQKKPLPKWAIAAIIIGITLAVGVAGSLLGGKMRDGYQQPPAFPPDWVFPLVWTILYIAIGTATFLVFIADQDPKRRRNDMIIYGIHLFFNMLWPLFFFRLDLVIFAIAWLVLNLMSATVVTCRYYTAHLAAGIIFTVYVMWLLYALYLNMGVALLN